MRCSAALLVVLVFASLLLWGIMGVIAVHDAALQGEGAYRVICNLAMNGGI